MCLRGVECAAGGCGDAMYLGGVECAVVMQCAWVALGAWVALRARHDGRAHQAPTQARPSTVHYVTPRR
jgi:hypothetical protein